MHPVRGADGGEVAPDLSPIDAAVAILHPDQTIGRSCMIPKDVTTDFAIGLR
jgi:hypothetical protein